MAAELGGISDDEDSDSEFVDPDQEELHPFLLQQRNKAEQAQVQKAQAAARAAQQAAAAAAAAVVKTEPVAAGVKRPRETSPGAANVPVKAQKTEAKPEAATAADRGGAEGYPTRREQGDHEGCHETAAEEGLAQH
jgi:transcription initiation factor TFIIF subunit alpha